MKKFTLVILSLAFTTACASKPYEQAQCVDELVMPVQMSASLWGFSTGANAEAEPTFCLKYQ